MKQCSNGDISPTADLHKALAYGYFEALLRAEDPIRIQSEIVRLKSMNNLLNLVGNDPMLYEDFVQETFDLLERTRADLPCVDGGAMLLASFNDVGITSSIITHFRVSQASTLTVRPSTQRSDMDPAHHQCMDENQSTSVRRFPSRYDHQWVLCEQNRPISGRNRAPRPASIA